MLLKRKLVDIDTLVDAYGESGAMGWEKLKPLVEGFRKQYKMPRAFEWFEYLYNEMKKRKHRKQKTLLSVFSSQFFDRSIDRPRRTDKQKRGLDFWD